jgi:type IV secretion system protein VirB11
MLKNITALDEYLKPLEPWLRDKTINEISINEPTVAFIEQNGCLQKISLPELTYYHLEGLARLIARYTDQRLSEKEPLLSAMLPTGERIQIICPPATMPGRIVMSIRKQIIEDLSLQNYIQQGAFSRIQPCYITHSRQVMSSDNDTKMLRELFDAGRYADFIYEAISQRKNILIAGGTGTGKTTFLNACLKEIPLHERIITLEDVSEVRIPHVNKVQLLASRGKQGIAEVTMQELMEASLRLHPDRIIVGEIRGKEALQFCAATATGHDGSFASIHASSPPLAFMRLVHLMKLNPEMNLSREDLLQDLYSLVDVIIQMKRDHQNHQYYRYISELYFADAIPFQQARI